MFLFKKRPGSRKVIDEGRTVKLKNESDSLSYRIGNLQKVGSRSSQEDSFALVNALDVNEIAQNGFFAIVADGMGGMKDGKLVSEAAVKGLVQAFHCMDKTGNIPEQMADNVRLVNQALYRQFDGDGGTTAVCVLLYQGKAFWTSVGDSSIYLRRDGSLYRLNQAHTYQNELFLKEIYKNTIDKKAIEKNPDGVRLSEFLGNSRLDAVDYNRKPLNLRNQDVILLCSDGISSYLDEAVINSALVHPPEKACELLQSALEVQAHRNQDNYTALIISCLK